MKLRRNQSSSHRILDEFSATLDLKMLHHGVLVVGDGPRGDFQNPGDLLHRVPLGQQLKHLPLARAQPDRLFRPPRLMQKRVDQPPGGQRRDVRTSLRHFPDGLEQFRGGRVLQRRGRGGLWGHGTIVRC